MTTTPKPRFEIPPSALRKPQTPDPIRQIPRLVRRGSLLFRIFTQHRRLKTRDSGLRTYVSHTLTYRLNGRRQRVVRSKLSDIQIALAEAETAIANGQTDLLSFTHTDRALLQRLRQLAANCDVPLEILVSEAVAARKDRARTNIVDKDCPGILEELLEAKRAEHAGRRWVDDLESRLNRFVKDFPGPISLVNSETLRVWLTRLNLSRRSVNNYRTALLAFVAFAKDRRYLPKTWDELETIKPNKIEKEEEELYTPEELRSLLFTAEKHYPQHLPTLAIMGLAGCRHSEMRDLDAALDWRDVHLGSGQIHVRSAVAKSNTGRRYVPMQPALVEWLKPYVKPRGPVCEVLYFGNVLAKIARKARVTPKRNALRNSFISYRCAITHDVAKVAAEAGNSPAEIHKSYRKEITEAEAQRWFEIYPTKADVLPLFAYGKV